MSNINRNNYYILDSDKPHTMLLSSLEDPSDDDNWFWGKKFVNSPLEKIDVCIIPGYENWDICDYFGTPPVMSNRFYQVLLDAGVDNLDVYNTILSSEDDKIKYDGFKAFNVIGLIKAAGKETVYSEENESRLIDASINKLSINTDATRGLKLFRLVEYAGAVVVHESVKKVIEKHSIPHITFINPENFIS